MWGVLLVSRGTEDGAWSIDDTRDFLNSEGVQGWWPDFFLTHESACEWVVHKIGGRDQYFRAHVVKVP